MVVGRLTLVLLHARGDDGQTRTWVVHEGRPRTLGRGLGADMGSDSISVAKRQASVGMDLDGPWVQDAQIPAGTFVDDGAGPRHIGSERVRLDHGPDGLPGLPVEGDDDPERQLPWVLWGRADVVELPKLPRPLRERRVTRLADGQCQQFEDGWYGW